MNYHRIYFLLIQMKLKKVFIIKNIPMIYVFIHIYIIWFILYFLINTCNECKLRKSINDCNRFYICNISINDGNIYCDCNISINGGDKIYVFDINIKFILYQK